jgi:hypothetical protein
LAAQHPPVWMVIGVLTFAKHHWMGFEIIMAVKMLILVFWGVTI